MVKTGQNAVSILALFMRWRNSTPYGLPEETYDIVIHWEQVITSFPATPFGMWFCNNIEKPLWH